MSRHNLIGSKSIGYLAAVGHLIRRDLRLFKEEFLGKIIDTSVILFTTVLVFSYLLPSYGLKADYGAFFLIGLIASFGLFEMIGKVGVMIADLEGDRTILYTLTLPLPSRLVFAYIGVSWALISALIALMLFPIGKLILLSQFDLSQISLWRFFLIFSLSNLFFGFFALWLVSVLKNMRSISHLFVRVINPLYMFGCYYYSWATVWGISAKAGYLHLLNPVVYIMEGMRAATLGQAGYLPFWMSLTALALFTACMGWDAIRRLEKRLDCVVG